MFRGLLRLGLDQDRPLETDLVLVLHHQVEETAELVELTLHVGVEKRLIPLATAPQDIVLAAQALGHIHRRLHLSGGIGEDVRVRIGGRPRHVPAVREEVCGSPQKLRFRGFHLARENVADLVEIANAFREVGPFGSRVAIMEAEEGDAEPVEHFEGDIRLHPGSVHRVAKPGALEGLAAEGVATGPAERVPVGHGEAKVILHAAAEHHAIGIVPAVGIIVVAVRPFMANERNVIEKAGHDRASLQAG